MDIETCKKKLSYLKSKRTSYESNYKDISKFLVPDRVFFDGENAGQERTDRFKNLIDPTATIALKYFAAGMQGGLNSPSRPWFKLQSPDPEKNKVRAVKEWFSQVERKLYAIFASSNFYTCSHNIYMEEGSFGTGALFMEEDFRKVVRFNVLTAGEYWIDQGPDGKIDTLYRECYMVAKNMMNRWGDRCTDQVRTAVQNSNLYQLFKVIHQIEPREGRDVTKIDSLNMAYRSLYFEESGLDILSESGYDACPISVPRWSNVGVAVYGTGPGQEVLRQVKMLQEMNLTKLKAEHLRVDPPVVAPESLRNKGMNTLPGGKNYLDQDKLGQFGPLFNVNYDPSSAIEGIDDVRRIIERSLFTDLFIMMVEKPDMTATEVLERKQEKLFTLGPAIEKQTDEYLDTVIDFVFAAALRRGILPPAPDELQGEELEIEYISTLAQAQKLAGLQQLQAYVSMGVDLAQVNPEIVDKLDVDAIMDEVADITGVAPKCNRSEEDVQQIRDQRAQQQQQALADSQAQAQADRMKTLGDTNMEGPNALTELQKAMGQ
jgi:hypothetical protein